MRQSNFLTLPALVLISAAAMAMLNFASSAGAASAKPLPAAQVKAQAAAPKLETATLAAGCFWGVEDYFRKVPGVVETKVGYTGGKMKNPAYEKVAEGTTGHAETVEIKFDPTKVTYAQLLDQFFKMHDPTTLNRQGNDAGTQYRSAIFFHGDEQKKIAEQYKLKVDKSKAWKTPVTTEIAPAGDFYDAEGYHQKYLVKNPGGYDNHYVRKLNFDTQSGS